MQYAPAMSETITYCVQHEIQFWYFVPELCCARGLHALTQRAQASTSLQIEIWRHPKGRVYSIFDVARRIVKLEFSVF